MKVASFFAGCGGLDLGFTQAGYEIIWANELDKSIQVSFTIQAQAKNCPLHPQAPAMQYLSPNATQNVLRTRRSSQGSITNSFRYNYSQLFIAAQREMQILIYFNQ